MNRKDKRVIHIGTVSMTVIFAVLALVTFALLSWSSAQVQWKLAQKLAERTDTYYRAETQAVRWLEQIVTEPVTWELFSWKTAVGENQQLEISVRAEALETGTYWQLERWQLTALENEREEETLSLYNGEKAGDEQM